MLVRAKIVKLLAYFLVMFMPIVPAILWLGVFVFLDLVTGIIKAKKKGEQIRSKKLGNSITKIVMYFISILCSKVMDDVFLHTGYLPFTITQACIAFIGITEFKSILENVSEILGMPIYKYISSKINNLRNIE